MNGEIRDLIRYVCTGKVKLARQQARIILEANHFEKDRHFKQEMLYWIDKSESAFIELPSDLKSLLVAEPPSNYSDSKFLLRETEKAITEKLLATYRAAERLSKLGISYYPSLILYGESGCGKTELARYIAYRADLPFVYVKFSNLVDGVLGNTQKNIGKIFNFVRSNPCVLCFDEIDTVGLARGQKDDVGEMNRIVIALMQELDRMPNDVIIIGTTNRFEALDKALVRRFSLHYEVTPLTYQETEELIDKFFGSVGMTPPPKSKLLDEKLLRDRGIPAYKIVKSCTEYIVQKVLEEEV